MDDLARQVAALRFRLRLQMLVVTGAFIAGIFALGGADVVARVLVESPAWIVRTNNAAGALRDRITVTTGENNVRVKFTEAHLELAQQPTSPSLPAAGALWYDSTTNKLKFYNGSAWAESGGGGVVGGSVVENDAWRLEYMNSINLGLKGIGNGGGTININGTLYGFSADPGIGALGLTAGTLYRVYAYWTGSVVALEISTTAATNESYGVYSSKSGDTSRRFVGLCVPPANNTFGAEMVRSVKNERGYCFMKKYVPTGNTELITSSTTWQDMDAVNLVKDGLFFDRERVRLWCVAMTYVGPLNISRYSRLGVSVNGTPVEDSETGSVAGRGSGYANPFSSQRAEAYYTVDGSGLRSLKAIHKTVSGYASDFFLQPELPASIGYEVVR